MMWWMWIAMGAPPEGLEVEDPTPWEEANDRAFDGPAGCWDFTGTAALTLSFQSKSTFFKRAEINEKTFDMNFQGRLSNGKWTSFTTDKRKERTAAGTTSFTIDSKNGADIDMVQPVIGTKSFGAETTDGTTASSADAVNLLRQALTGWETRTGTSHVQWREQLQGVELVQEVPVSDDQLDQVVTMTTFFPGGDPHPARVSATLPKKMTFGQWPAVGRVYDGQIHLVQRSVGGHVLPIAETLSGVGTALGFTVGFEQRLDYKTAQMCRE